MSPAVSTLTRTLVDPLLAVVFPSRCPACGSGVAHPSRGPLCESCWERLPRHGSPRCCCGVPLAPRAPGQCGRCRRGLSPFEAGASLGPYEGVLRTLLHELKYHGRRKVAARLAEAPLASPGVARVVEPGVVLVPVPLHPSRRRGRGYKHSEPLAQGLARMGLRWRPALVRHKDTAPGSRPPVEGQRSRGLRRKRPERALRCWWTTCSPRRHRPACAQALRKPVEAWS